MPTQNKIDRHPPGNPYTQPGKEGKGRGMGWAVEEARPTHMQRLHRHSHTKCTMESLNNVDRPQGDYDATYARDLEMKRWDHPKAAS